MAGLTMRIGGDGPIVAHFDATGRRLDVRVRLHARGADGDALHDALRRLALDDRELARTAFGVVMHCAGSWEDEYTEIHGADALDFDEWMERIEFGGVTIVDAAASSSPPWGGADARSAGPARCA